MLASVKLLLWWYYNFFPWYLYGFVSARNKFQISKQISNFENWKGLLSKCSWISLLNGQIPHAVLTVTAKPSQHSTSLRWLQGYHFAVSKNVFTAVYVLHWLLALYSTGSIELFTTGAYNELAWCSCVDFISWLCGFDPGHGGHFSDEDEQRKCLCVKILMHVKDPHRFKSNQEPSTKSCSYLECSISA